MRGFRKGGIYIQQNIICLFFKEGNPAICDKRMNLEDITLSETSQS